MFATGYINDLLLIRRQMAELQFTAPVITMIAGPAYREFVEALGPAAENVTSASWWQPAVALHRMPGAVGLDGRVRRRPTRPSSARCRITARRPSAACGIAVQLAAQAAGSTEPQALRDALAALDAPTFFGPLKFGPSGQVTALKPPVLQIQGGKPVVLYPAEIKQAAFRRV